MNKKLYTGFVLVFLIVFVVSATIFVAKAAFSLNLNPLSGEPGDVIGVQEVTGEFEPLTAVGIGFGAEVEVADESVTTSHPDSLTWTGYTANTPIKPGTFRWVFLRGALPVEIYDNGDGALGDYAGFLSSGEINYTSGFFRRTTHTTSTIPSTGDKLNYTTYEFDVTPEDGATTAASGFLLETMTVPSVPNGTYTVTAIDEMGNVGTANFQVIGSDVIPEPLTVGAIALLSSTSVIVSFYCLRKRHNTESAT